MPLANIHKSCLRVLPLRRDLQGREMHVRVIQPLIQIMQQNHISKPGCETPHQLQPNVTFKFQQISCFQKDVVK